MAIKVSESKYRRGQIAIQFGTRFTRHVSEQEAETLAEDLMEAAGNVQATRVNRELSERRLREEKKKHEKQFGAIRRGKQ